MSLLLKILLSGNTLDVTIQFSFGFISMDF